MNMRRGAGMYLAVGVIVLGAGVATADECVDPGGGGCHLTIQAGINAADPGEIINVAAATYVERLTIPKSVVLRGAQAGVDPTPGGARTTPAAESIVDFTALARLNPNVEIQIGNGVSGVTIDGFTLVGHPDELVSDESIIRVGSGSPSDNDNIEIVNNIMSGWKPVLFKGGNSDVLTVSSNRMVANKNGLVVQVAVNDITVSGNTFAAGVPLAGDPAAMQTTAILGGQILNNTATGFTDGRAFGGSNLNELEIRGNDFTSNKDGVNIFGDSGNITIAENELSDNSRYGVNIKAADVLIEANQVLNNGDSGVNIARHVNDSLNNVVTCNDFVGNTINGLKVDSVNVPTVLAENNWWGDASGPTNASNPGGTGDVATDGSDFDPWNTESSTTAASCQPPPVPGHSTLLLVLLAVLFLVGLLVAQRGKAAGLA